MDFSFGDFSFGEMPALTLRLLLLPFVGVRAQGSRDARIIRAEADAEAARVYATAFGKDPEFYDFYRAMQSYDATFSNSENPSESSIILSPDNEYLRQFRGRR